MKYQKKSQPKSYGKLLLCITCFLLIVFLTLLNIDNIPSILSQKLAGAVTLTKINDKNCKILKHTNNLDSSINIVFVPSGFKGNLESYEESAKDIWKRMQKYSIYNSNINELNIFYVTKEASVINDFCISNIPGIAPQFLFCRPLVAKNLSSVCSSKNTYTVVIDNTKEYAGAGLWMFDLATISSNSAAYDTAVHEISHAIFGFGDEYTASNNFYSTANTVPNCDVAGCPKWKDLIPPTDTKPNNSTLTSRTKNRLEDQLRNGDGGNSPQQFGCYPNACAEGKYYSAGPGSLMGSNYINGKLYPSHERVACCTYKKVSGVYPPSLCTKFKTAGKSLDTFCKETSNKNSESSLDSAQVFKYNLKTQDYDIVASPAIKSAK